MIGRAALAAALCCAASAAEAQQVPRNDRRPLIQPGTSTTDDPVRIPRKPPVGGDRDIVLAGGRVFTATDEAVRAATVVIRGNRIHAILPPESRSWAADARVIDVGGKTIMPGLIDMHVHLTYPDRDTPYDEQTGDGGGVLRGQRNLRWFLESGFTTVRDLNGVGNAPYLLAEASADGVIPAPRVITAGHIITGTGGHATERPITPSHGPEYAWEADGPDAWRAAVRRTFKAGGSVVKIASHFAPAEVAAAVEEAHLLGVKVTCDCESIYTDMAVAAGVDMIEHPLPRSSATIAMMAKRGVASVPTLQVYHAYIERAGGFFGSTSRRFTMTSDGNFEMFRRLVAAGVTMGVGTDTIGEANKAIPATFIAELKWFVKGGYSITGALRAATATNAALLDMGDRLGTLEPGKLADVVVIDGKPDQNLDDLSRVTSVMKDGVLVVEDGRVVIPRRAAAQSR